MRDWILKSVNWKTRVCVCVCGRRTSLLSFFVFFFSFLFSPSCLRGHTCFGHDFIQTGAISNASITSVIVSSTLQQRLGRQGFDKINVRALSAISLWPSQTRWEHVPWEVLQVDDESEGGREGEEWSERETSSSKGVSKRSDKDTNTYERALEEKQSKDGRRPLFSPARVPQ